MGAILYAVLVWMFTWSWAGQLQLNNEMNTMHDMASYAASMDLAIITGKSSCLKNQKAYDPKCMSPFMDNLKTYAGQMVGAVTRHAEQTMQTNKLWPLW